jgi:hypothetical protein
MKADGKQSKVFFLLDLFFYLEDGGDMFLRNFGCLSKDCTAIYPEIYNSS